MIIGADSTGAAGKIPVTDVQPGQKYHFAWYYFAPAWNITQNQMLMIINS